MQADPESQPPLSELGWDPLLSWPALEVFAEKLAKQRRAVKAVLLDQVGTVTLSLFVRMVLACPACPACLPCLPADGRRST